MDDKSQGSQPDDGTDSQEKKKLGEATGSTDLIEGAGKFTDLDTLYSKWEVVSKDQYDIKIVEA